MGPAWLTQPVTPSSFLPLPISSSLLLWPQFSISANVPISFIATAPLWRPSGSRRALPFCPQSDLLVEPLHFLKIKIFDDTAVDGLCWYDSKSCSLSSYCECKRIIYKLDCMCFWCCPTGRTEFWRESRECGSHLFPGLIHNRLRWMPRSILLCIVLSDRQNSRHIAISKRKGCKRQNVAQKWVIMQLNGSYKTSQKLRSCPGHYLIVNHFPSMSWFKFRKQIKINS